MLFFPPPITPHHILFFNGPILLWTALGALETVTVLTRRVAGVVNTFTDLFA
jgi:hypothetical protein